MKIKHMKIKHGIKKLIRALANPKAHAVYTGIGIVTTAGATGYFSWKACEKVTELKKENPYLTTGEAIKAAAPYYILPTVATVGTLGMLSKTSKSYSKVVKGLNKAYLSRSQASAEYKALAMGVPAAEVLNGYYNKPKEVVVKDDEVVFYDVLGHRYFKSTPERVLRAEQDFNRAFQNNGCVNLNELYSYLELPPIEEGDILCWDAPFMFDWFETYVIDFDDTTEYDMGDGGTCRLFEPCILPRYYDEKSSDWIDYYDYPDKSLES